MKQRESSQLKNEIVFKIIDIIKKLVNNTEDLIAKLIRIDIFSFERFEIAKEENSL